MCFGSININSKNIYAEPTKGSLIATIIATLQTVGQAVGSDIKWIEDALKNGLVSYAISKQLDKILNNPNKKDVDDLNNQCRDIVLNGPNKNYFVDGNYVENYSPITFSPTTNEYSLYYKNNNTVNNYSVDLSKTYYNITNNTYHFDITNNYYISISNTYNSTYIIDNGNAVILYYQLPDGSSSLNLTEETALNGFKTSLSVGSYDHIITDNSLIRLWHFDSNDKNSAYDPWNDDLLSIYPASIQYVKGQEDFGNAIAFDKSTEVEINRDGGGYSFRFFPILNTKFELILNYTSIGTTQKNYVTTSTFEEYQQENNTLSTGAPFTYSFYETYSGQQTVGCPFVMGYTASINGPHWVDNDTVNVQCLYTPTGYSQWSDTTTTIRQYNFINDAYYDHINATNLINYGMWNYIYVSPYGEVYINGLYTSYRAPMPIERPQGGLSINFKHDGVVYFDELAYWSEYNSVSHHNVPMTPFQDNIAYTLPSNPKNNELLIQSYLSVNNYKFGGIRPVQPNRGDVYVNVDDYGFIELIQQFDGTDWVQVKGALYNQYLDMWITAVGFNIYNNNWNVVEEQFNVSSNDGNTFIRFFTKKFDDLKGAISNLVVKVNVDQDNSITNNISNQYHIDVNTNIHDLITDVYDNDFKNNLDLPGANLTQPLVTGLTGVGSIMSLCVNTMFDANLGFVILIPLVLIIVGLFV